MPSPTPLPETLLALWSRVFVPAPVTHGPTHTRAIALTFDDGPNPQTVPLLEILARHNIPATFFLCGLNVQRHPEIARQLVASGHQLGNHTQTHARLCPRPSLSPNLLRPATVFNEFALAQQAIFDATGVTPAILRPPYGLPWFGMRRATHSLGLRTILWSAIGHDWEWPAPRIASHLAADTAPGSILCLHDGRDIQPNPDLTEMLTAVADLIPRLLDRGYTFRTIADLLRA